MLLWFVAMLNIQCHLDRIWQMPLLYWCNAKLNDVGPSPWPLLTVTVVWNWNSKTHGRLKFLPIVVDHEYGRRPWLKKREREKERKREREKEGEKRKEYREKEEEDRLKRRESRKRERDNDESQKQPSNWQQLMTAVTFKRHSSFRFSGIVQWHQYPHDFSVRVPQLWIEKFRHLTSQIQRSGIRHWQHDFRCCLP